MKKKQKRKGVERKRRILFRTLAVCILFLLAVLGGIKLKQVYDRKQEEKARIEAEIERKKQQEAEEMRKLEERLNVQVNLDIYSKSAIVKDIQNNKVLASKNAEERIYPASMTKILTALIAVEEISDLDEKIIIPVDEVLVEYKRGASMAGFRPGEEVSARDLLYGLMLPSGAECCTALACKISGSEEAFAEKMNQRAKELGMLNSHFVNASGLHEEDHYTTVTDIMILLEQAIKNEIFYEIFTTPSYTTAPTASDPDGITFKSTMYEKKTTLEVTDGEILGGKTGFTNAAGLCLASLANVEGQEYILVTAGADGNHNTEPFHVLDAENIYSQIGAAIQNE